MFGLLDYFPAASAKRIVTGLWNLVAAGGRLVVTNAHPSNPTRTYLEYAGDWFLQYKDETTMRALVSDLVGIATTELSIDNLGIYQYLEVKRNG